MGELPTASTSVMGAADMSDVPAPWVLKAECFVFTGYKWSTVLPPGAFDHREADTLAGHGVSPLHRALSSLVIFRYTESPVGPYDELMFIPGFFTVPEMLKDRHVNLSRIRITRIYVSTDASIYNGRRNWNIPKHKADFTFTAAAGAIEISIKLPQSDRPFFAATVTPSSAIPSFPFKWSWLPLNFALCQPPLPHLNNVEGGSTIGDTSSRYVTDWKETAFSLDMRGAKIAYLNANLDNFDAEYGTSGKKLADGINFPNATPFATGLYCKAATVHFDEPRVVEVLVNLPKAEKLLVSQY